MTKKIFPTLFTLPLFTLIALFVTLVVPDRVLANQYVIYAITQTVPMGYEKEVIKKNFYINMGEIQGIKQGTILDVYRTISQNDPYTNKGQFHYRIKVGELQVIHSESNAAIADLLKLNQEKNGPILDINGLIIGDEVQIHLE